MKMSEPKTEPRLMDRVLRSIGRKKRVHGAEDRAMASDSQSVNLTIKLLDGDLIPGVHFLFSVYGNLLEVERK